MHHPPFMQGKVGAAVLALNDVAHGVAGRDAVGLHGVRPPAVDPDAVGVGHRAGVDPGIDLGDLPEPRVVVRGRNGVWTVVARASADAVDAVGDVVPGQAADLVVRRGEGRAALKEEKEDGAASVPSRANAAASATVAARRALSRRLGGGVALP